LIEACGDQAPDRACHPETLGTDRHRDADALPVLDASDLAQVDIAEALGEGSAEAHSLLRRAHSRRGFPDERMVHEVLRAGVDQEKIVLRRIARDLDGRSHEGHSAIELDGDGHAWPLIIVDGGIGHREQTRSVIEGDEVSDQEIVTEETIEPAAPGLLDRLQVDHVDLMATGPQAGHVEGDIRDPLDLDLSLPGPVDVRLFPWREG